MPTVNLAMGVFNEIAKVHFAQAREMAQQKIFEPHFIMLGGSGYFDMVYHLKSLPHKKKIRSRWGCDIRNIRRPILTISWLIPR